MSKLNGEPLREAIAIIMRESEEKKLKMRKLQSEALREAITAIKKKSKEKKRDFVETVELHREALREAITTTKDKSEEKKHNFVEIVELQIVMKNYEPQRDKRFSGSVKLPHIAIRK